MKINSLSISGIGRIRELELNFNSGFNAICGTNGVGKTTILRTIVHAYATKNSYLKRNATYPEGEYSIQIVDKNEKIRNFTNKVKEFEPTEAMLSVRDRELAPYLMFFGENRFLEYYTLQSIPKDRGVDTIKLSRELENGVLVDDLKGWFVNRVLFSKIEESLSEERLANLELAKRSFSILDPKIEFKTIDSRSLDIILSSQNGDIYYEYLSAGYKSCLYLILGILKEIEYRFGGSSVKAEDFDGVVLIDEIDLHLHPIWQSRLVEALKELFPKVQFIVTTHSPSVLQILERKEIIPLTQDDYGNVFVKKLNLTDYGLQGWSVEEILRDVMEMPETTSNIYEKTKKAFEHALNIDDKEAARSSYRILKQMIHPNSVVSRLLDIQAAGLGEVE